ncbi:MAG TPA: ATP phosphoribosyltransferase regulatory subunit, partial [Ktedonobacteraceae bacterium]|nr:ATP phosphoribosyltransferase regulatory subunit [Ktedonobacteraceae bacterium]
VERFLWNMERNEQRRQILQALEFLRALHAVSGPPPEVFDALHDLLGRYELDAAPLAELHQLVAIVEQSGVPRESILLNLSLGRGVNYYTGLVFEMHATDDDGFDTQICGGGRYDRLMRSVGGTRDVKACGFAFGIERLLSLLPENFLPTPEVVQAFVIPVSPQDMPYALHVARSVRTSGMQAELDVTQRGVSGGLKLAARKHICLALIVGETEQQSNTVTVRDLSSGEEHLLELANIGQLLERIPPDTIHRDETAPL